MVELNWDRERERGISMETKERLLSPEEVADRLAISPKTVRAYLREGRIKAMKVGKLWRVRESDLQQYLKGDRI
jgi:excisionase family DNA binding protein